MHATETTLKQNPKSETLLSINETEGDGMETGLNLYDENDTVRSQDGM